MIITTTSPLTVLPISREELQDLLTEIEGDFGFEYGIDFDAIVKLRKLIGGAPHGNVEYYHAGRK